MFKNLIQKAKNLISKPKPTKDAKEPEIIQEKAVFVQRGPTEWRKRPRLKAWGTPMPWADTEKFRGGRALMRKRDRQKRRSEVLSRPKGNGTALVV